MSISNTEPTFSYFGGYLPNKTKLRNRQLHIHTDLKWSSQPQSGLELPQLAPEWPGHPLKDQLGQLGAPEGLSGYDRTSQEPVGSSQGHSGTVRTASGPYEYVLVYFRTRVCFANNSAPWNSTKLVLYQNFTYGTQFSEEINGLEICLLVLEILKKQTL